jgi:glutaredoxin
VDRRWTFVIPVTIYSRPGCHLCDDMKLVVKHVGESFDLAFEEIDISTDPELERLYGLEIPVLFVAGKKAAKYRISERDLVRILTEKEKGTP